MQGWFDVEVQAKTIRNELQRAVERQRMIDEALGQGRYASKGHDFSLARVFGCVRARLAGQRPAGAPAPQRAQRETANVAVLVASEQKIAPTPRPVTTSDLYSGMVVIARNLRTQPLAESSGARER